MTKLNLLVLAASASLSILCESWVGIMLLGVDAYRLYVYHRLRKPCATWGLHCSQPHDDSSGNLQLRDKYGRIRRVQKSCVRRKSLVNVPTGSRSACHDQVRVVVHFRNYVGHHRGSRAWANTKAFYSCGVFTHFPGARSVLHIVSQAVLILL